MSDYDSQIANLTKKIEENKSTLKTAESNLKSLLSAPTNERAKLQIEEIKNNIIKLENKLSDLRNTTQVVSVEEKKHIMNEHEYYYKEYR